MAENRVAALEDRWVRATGLANWLERKPGVVIIFLTCLYLLLIVVPVQRPFWFDELFTFYVAQSHSMNQFVQAVEHVDLQPPMIFATTWLSQHILGANEVGTRLPSVLAFYGASMGILFYLKRRTGVLWAGVAVLLLWFSFFFLYATEARPYGLLLGFFVLSLNCYDRSTDSQAQGFRRWWIAGLFLGNVAMMLTHVFAPFSLMAFGIAELARTAERRRVDWTMWFAIVAPLGIAAGYLPLIRQFQVIYFPPYFQASLKKIVLFYPKLAWHTLPCLLAAGAVAFWVVQRGRGLQAERPPRFNATQIAVALGMMLPPVLINLTIMRTAGAFWDRYCITTVPMVYIICTVIIAMFCRWAPGAALAVFCAVLVAGLIQTAVKYRPNAPVHTFEAIRPDLPWVDASGVAFLEMDHYERPAFLKRLFYLTDREAALRYAHATLFEGLSELHEYFPIRARVLPYSEFVRRNRHFLVLASPHAPEDWVLDKLASDGAAIQEIQTVESQYQNKVVYEVRLRN